MREQDISVSDKVSDSGLEYRRNEALKQALVMLTDKIFQIFVEHELTTDEAEKITQQLQTKISNYRSRAILHAPS